MDKDKIVAAAREIYAQRYGEIDAEKGCLYWASAFDRAASGLGLQSLIQAGSVQFQFRDDDGISVTHFSYMFDTGAAMTRIAQGLPPEIHVWNALRDTGEIIDLTTGFQAAQARRLIGETWDAKYALPDYYWGKPSDDRMIYTPHATATLYALQKLNHPALSLICRTAKGGRG